MSIDDDFARSELLDRICDLVQQASIGGGVGTSLNHLRKPGVAKAGEGLELWVKHFLAGTINRSDDDATTNTWNKIFSFHGGVSNPPDVMIRNSLAAEVKKIESPRSSLQLNSSWPIRTLYSDDQHITQDCKDAEDWNEKPFVFIVGRVNPSTKSVQSLSIVDGRCLSDFEAVYIDLIVKAQEQMLVLGSSQTKEIGKFNSVDALSRTSLRVRPMFSLVNPSVAFSDIFQEETGNKFVLNVLVPETTYDSFSNAERVRIESFNSELNVVRTDIDDPTGSSSRMKVVHISGSW